MLWANFEGQKPKKTHGFWLAYNWNRNPVEGTTLFVWKYEHNSDGRCRRGKRAIIKTKRTQSNISN